MSEHVHIIDKSKIYAIGDGRDMGYPCKVAGCEELYIVGRLEGKDATISEV